MSVTLSVLEYQGTKITSLLKELASITRAQLQLLKNVVNLDKRCQIVEAGHHVVNVGDKVIVGLVSTTEYDTNVLPLFHTFALYLFLFLTINPMFPN